jgi:hypothetical protein
MEFKKAQTLDLINSLYINLEKATEGKLSSDEININRFWWEVINKLFTILVTLENSLRTKDSLTTHLVARYIYELLIVCEYVSTSSKFSPEQKVKDFLAFNQFRQNKRDWKDSVTYKDMLKEVNSQYLNLHQDHYRHLSNFSHPTPDSFFLNRRGEKNEFKLIMSTCVLSVGTILEILKVCFEKSDFFNDIEKEKINLAILHLTASSSSKSLAVNL